MSIADGALLPCPLKELQADPLSLQKPFGYIGSDEPFTCRFLV